MIYDIIACHLSARKLCFLCFLFISVRNLFCCLYACLFVCLSATIMVNKDEYKFHTSDVYAT